MDARTEELIRMKAFELSQLPDRNQISATRNWLDAERLIVGGLAEDTATFDTTETLDDNGAVTEMPLPTGDRKTRNGKRSAKR